MSYAVKLTMHAIEQIRETVAYISEQLLVPETAKAWSDYLKKEISEPDTMPKGFPLVDNEPWKTYGIRKKNVKNFIVYYWINEEEKIVFVTAVVYARRDQLNSLKEMPL